VLELRHQHSLKDLLSAAQLARSTYYYQKAALQAVDKYADAKNRIREIFERHKGRYGYRRILCTLRAEGSTLNHKTVRRLMQVLRLRCRARTKKYRAYRGELGLAAPNALARQFNAVHPNEKWVTDVTEFNVHGRKLYLSPIMDLYNGEIVAFETSTRPLFTMVEGMLEKAFERVDKSGLILHSDQGWQYRMPRYRALLKNRGITQSMSRRGNCLDNAAMESFFATLKSELYHIDTFNSVEHLKAEIAEYIRYYNLERIKISLNGLSPVDYRMKAALA
jgi:transposase InsO family protein